MEYVFYSLTDPLEIKITILYTLNALDTPVRITDFTHILIEATNINYFSLQEQLADLIYKGDVAEIYRDNHVFVDITERGLESLSCFKDKVPYSVKTHLNESIRNYYKRQKYENEIVAEITPINHEEYTVDCKVNYAKTPMLSLSLYAGSRESAQKLKRYFQKHATEVYSEIIESMTKERETHAKEDEAKNQ